MEVRRKDDVVRRGLCPRCGGPPRGSRCRACHEKECQEMHARLALGPYCGKDTTQLFGRTPPRCIRLMSDVDAYHITYTTGVFGFLIRGITRDLST